MKDLSKNTKVLILIGYWQCLKDAGVIEKVAIAQINDEIERRFPNATYAEVDEMIEFIRKYQDA